MSIRGQGQGRLGALPIPFATALPGPRTRPAGPDHAATARHTWHTPPHGGWQARRHAPAKPIPHTRGDGTTPAASLQRGKARTGLPFSYRLDPPNTPKGHTQQPEAAAAATPGRGHWGDRSNTTTRLQAPEAQPGPLQGHRTGSSGVKAPQPQPTTGRQRGMPATSQDPSTPRAQKHGDSRGRAGFRTPATHTPPTGGEGRTRGPQARTRGSAAFAMNGRPSSGAA